MYPSIKCMLALSCKPMCLIVLDTFTKIGIGKFLIAAILFSSLLIWFFVKKKIEKIIFIFGESESGFVLTPNHYF